MKLTLDTSARSDLVLPLSGHDLCVGSGNLDAGICCCVSPMLWEQVLEAYKT
jgi:hypothetical protein